ATASPLGMHRRLSQRSAVEGDSGLSLRRAGILRVVSLGTMRVSAWVNAACRYDHADMNRRGAMQADRWLFAVAVLTLGAHGAVAQARPQGAARSMRDTLPER